MALNKRKLISGVLCLSVISGIYLHNSKYISDKELDETYRMKTLSEKMLEKHEKEIHRNKMLEDKQKEIVVFLNSEEYSIRQRKQQTLDMLINKTGLNVVDYTEFTAEISFYTDLNCENGFGSVNSLGESLSDGMVANNVLPIGTKIQLDGYGFKEVRDKGSDKYFSEYNKFDVFVPRLNGEYDSQYYKRIQKMGRKKVVGYILEVE